MDEAGPAEQSILRRLGRCLHAALAVTGVGVVAAMILATGLGAVGRYAHLRGVAWSFELVGILFLWVTAIGVVLAETVGENVSIDGNTVTSRRGPLVRSMHAIVLLSVAAAFVWSGLAYLERVAFVPTPVMRMPTFVSVSIVLFMGVGLGVLALARLFKVLR